jgi:hypothetical protein
MMMMKYVRSTVKGDNSIQEEINGRIALGSKAYSSNQTMFKNNLVPKKTKFK